MANTHSPVQHLAVDRPNRFGGTTHTTLCGRGRFQSAGDDMNRVEDRAAVTCKFCLRLLSKATGEKQ